MSVNRVPADLKWAYSRRMASERLTPLDPVDGNLAT